MAKKRDSEESEPEVVAEPEAVAPPADEPAPVAADFVKYPMAVHKQGQSLLVRDDAEYERAKADGFTDEVGG